VPVEIRTWGILNVKYYRDPSHLKITHYKHYHTGEMQSDRYGNTTWNYKR